MPSPASRAANSRAAIDEPGLADAVLAAVGRRHLGRHRRDEDDRGGERRIGVPPLDLIARDRLGQEVRPLQVRAQQLFEAVFGRVEQVGAHARRAAGVVDERVDRAEALRAASSTSARAIVAGARDRPRT